MSVTLDQLRHRMADLARAQYDFGQPLLEVNRWQEDGRDALTCRVRIRSSGETRRLSFRVVFQPESAELHHVAVAERLAVV